MRHTSTPLVLAGLIVVATAALAQDGKDPEKAVKAQLAKLAQAHASNAAHLATAGFKGAAFRELLLAIELDPDCGEARSKLGYKKEATGWAGAPLRPAADAPLPEKLAKATAALHKQTAQALATAAAKAPGELARRLAGLALEAEPENPKARELLGHARKGTLWLSPHEKAIQEAFAGALANAEPGAAKVEGDDAALLATLKLDADARATAHAAVFATKGANEPHLDALARAVEATWVAVRAVLGGEDTGFSLPGPTREASGTHLSERLRAFVVAPAEYGPLVERVVSSKENVEFYKRCTGFHDRVSLGAGVAWIAGSGEAAEHRAESLCDLVVDVYTDATLPQGAACPDFLLEGIRRFFAGHVSGRAEIFYMKPGSSGRRSFEGGTFDEFRATVREVVGASLEGDLRTLLSKSQNDMERPDSALAYAFLDFALEKHRGELARFLAEIKSGELPAVTFERVFAHPIEEVERELRSWAREEY